MWGALRGRSTTSGVVDIRVAPAVWWSAVLALAGCAADGGDGQSSSRPRGQGAGTASAGRNAVDAAGSSATGSNTPATNAAAGSSAGTPSGSAGGAGVTLESCTMPGATISCCNGGTRLCDGVEFPRWGPCLDADGQVVDCADPCMTDEFGRMCDAGTPPPPPPPDSGTPPDEPPGEECGPGMACKPGAIRYCDDPAGEWTLSTCDPGGQWGACVPTTAPAGATGSGCSDNDYAPELCCPVLVLCCQNDPFGAFEDWGSGACAAVSCP